MAFLDAFKRRLRRPGEEPWDERLPGGRTVQEAITGPPMQSPNGQVVAPQGREGTRPRWVNPPPQEPAPPDATRAKAESFDPETGRPIESFYRDRPDALEGTKGLYEAYQKWVPRGAKRGFKNSLKAGAMMASEAVRNNPNDPVTAAIAGFAAGAGGATAVPNFKNRLLRQWKLGQLGGELESGLDLAKTQAQIDATEMVPVTLENGQTVMVSQKQAGALQSRQQEIGLRGDTLEARKRRWDSLSSTERRRQIVAEYKAGLLNNDPRALEQAARELDIPGTLLPAFISGQMRDAIDAQGNIVEVNRQTGAVTDTGTKSFEATKEAGRQRRAEMAEAGRAARAGGAKGGPKGLTPYQQEQRKAKADALHADVQRYRDIALAASEALKQGPKAKVSVGGQEMPAQQALTEALRQARDAARRLNASYGDLYEAGEGDQGWGWSRPRPGEAPAPATGTRSRKGFSIGAYLKRNQGATEADARAYAKENFPGYPIVP